MKNTITTTTALLAGLALSACAPALLKTEGGGVPSLYQPGPAWDAPQGQSPISGIEEASIAKRGSLAPQELPQDKPDTWLGEEQPFAGPAPRNAISGGVLDVGVVPPAPEGKAAIAAPTHGIEPTDSGRLYILELYQEVLEQRDALDLEVSGLLAELERAQLQIAELRGTTMSEQSTVAALRQELALMRAENLDLAARLTTAQVRRLESEKLLLEAKIEMQRARLEEPTPVTSGIAMGDKNP